MKKLTISLLFCLSWLIGFSGAWPQKKGHGIVYVGERLIRSNEFLNKDKSSSIIPTTSLYTTFLYWEYGLSDKFTVQGYSPLFSRITKNAVDYTSGLFIEGDAVNSVGDFDFALKYHFLQKGKLVASILAQVGVPLGTTQGGNSQILQTGDGEFNQMVKLEVGSSLPGGLYTQGYVGINNRTKDFSEEFHYGIELGAGPGKWLFLIKAFGVMSFFNGEAEGASNGVFSNNTEYLLAGPEIGYRVTDNLMIHGATQAMLTGRNVLSKPSYQAGLILTISKPDQQQAPE